MTSERTVPLGFALAALVVLSLLALAGDPPSEFVHDDESGIHENPGVTGELSLEAVFIHDFWGRDASATVGTYRPVAVLFFRAVRMPRCGTPVGYRAAALLLHTAFVCIAFVVLRRIVTSNVALMASALMSVCAATSEAVLSDVANADILCAICVAAGFAAYRSTRRFAGIATAIAFLLAAGSKESGLLAPLVWLAFDWLLPSAVAMRTRIIRLAGCVVVAIPYFLGRHVALGTFFSPDVTDSLHNPLIGLAPLARALGAGRVFLTRYILGILLPQRRTYDCSANACGPAAWDDLIAWMGLALWLLVCAAPFLLRRRNPIAAAGLSWFALFFLPASNFLIAGPTIYGERLLYLPAIGLFLAAAAGATAVASRLARPQWAYAAVAVAMAGNIFADRVRLLDWRSTEELALSALEYSPNSALVLADAAIASRRKHDYAAVERDAREAISIYPGWMPPHRELAAALFATNRMAEAEQEYQAAFRSHATPGEEESLVLNYGNYLETAGQPQRAVSMIDSYLALSPNHPELIELRARLSRVLAAGPKKQAE